MISTITQRQAYNGDAVNMTFPVPFRYDDKSWIKLYIGNVLKILNTDYTLTAPGETGTIVTTTAPPTGTENIVVVRATPQTNVEHLPTEGPLSSITLERLMIDKLVMMVQDLQEQLNRCVKFPIFSAFDNIPLPDPAAGLLLAWNSTLTALVNTTVASLDTLESPVIVVAIAATEFTATINHGLNNINARLIGTSTTWFTAIRITSQTANTIVVEFSSPAPAGGGTLVAEVT